MSHLVGKSFRFLSVRHSIEVYPGIAETIRHLRIPTKLTRVGPIPEKHSLVIRFCTALCSAPRSETNPFAREPLVWRLGWIERFESFDERHLGGVKPMNIHKRSREERFSQCGFHLIVCIVRLPNEPNAISQIGSVSAAYILGTEIRML